jgi:hypothetical protein
LAPSLMAFQNIKILLTTSKQKYLYLILHASSENFSTASNLLIKLT